MGKRFTETSKWGDKWFRALGPYEKLGWQYLCDNCDAAGVIDLDRQLADFQVGHAVEWDKLFEAAEDRIEPLKRGKLWLTRFCDFQYGKLTEACRPHRPIIALLQKYGLLERVLEGYQNTTNTPKEKEKEKEQDKDKDKETEGVQGEPQQAPFDAWWQIVHHKTGRGAAEPAYAKAVAKLRAAGRDDPHGYLLDRMLAFARSPNAKPPDRTPIHPATWLNQARYDDDPETWNRTTKGPQNGRRDDIGAGQRHDPAAATRPPSIGWND